MRTQRGLTLVELLGVIAIAGIIMTLIMSVLLNGMNASKRNTTSQRLQQEANYIVETIRNEYLEPDSESKIKISINNSDNTLKMEDQTISEGYYYQLNGKLNTDISIDRDDNFPFELIITKDEISFTVNSTFSKLR